MRPRVGERRRALVSDGSGGAVALALLERERARLGAEGHRSLRLPLVPDAATQRLAGTGPGAAMGWCGAWPEGLAAALGLVLEATARAGLDPSSGLWLAGEGAECVEIPKIFLRRLTRRSGNRLALGLALLPLTDPAPVLGDIVALVAGGCPVLTTPEVAAAFEDRWHLPTAETPEGFADLARFWLDPATRDELGAAARRTRDAFHDDRERMTRYVAGELRARIDAQLIK